MKNKFILVVLSLYTLFILMFSFKTDFLENVNSSIANIFVKNIGDFKIVYDIIHYTELFIFYFGFSICVTIACIEYLDQFKYILIYSIILSLLVVVISTAIKSFYVSIDLLSILTILISVFIGIGLEILIKIKQSRGEKDEK